MRGVSNKHCLLTVFIVPEDCFNIGNGAYPDEMQHYATFHLGLHCLPKRPFVGHKETVQTQIRHSRIPLIIEPLKITICVKVIEFRTNLKNWVKHIQRPLPFL